MVSLEISVKFMLALAMAVDGSSSNSRSAAVYCKSESILALKPGKFADGSGSASYQANVNCTWLIVAPQGYISVLSFIRFDIEHSEQGRCWDYVEIFDGKFSDSASSMGRFCGTLTGQVSGTFRSTSSYMLVHFFSDRVTQKQGFEASYHFVPVYKTFKDVLDRVGRIEGRLSDVETVAAGNLARFRRPCSGDCSGHGKCVLALVNGTTEWSPTCECEAGYRGSNCSELAVVQAVEGNGRDGDLTVASSFSVNQYVSVSAVQGKRFVRVSSAVSFLHESDEVMLIQMQGLQAGQYEFHLVDRVEGQTVYLKEFLQNSYTTSLTNAAQLILVPNYRRVTIASSGSLRPRQAWNGDSGGVIIFRAFSASVGGRIEADQNGFRGAARQQSGVWSGKAGESYKTKGFPSFGSTKNNAGGGGSSYCSCGEAAGAASHGTPATNPSTAKGCSGQPHGLRGTTYGEPQLNRLYLGSGGGGGCRNDKSCEYTNGGNGGGLVFVLGGTLAINGGSISSKGGHASGGTASTCDDTIGGAGSGGTIYVKTKNLNLGTPSNSFYVEGGSRTFISQSSTYTGTGGQGRVRIDFSHLNGQRYGTQSAITLQGKISGIGYWGEET